MAPRRFVSWGLEHRDQLEDILAQTRAERCVCAIISGTPNGVSLMTVV
jgi:hypothetical protein